MSGHGHRLAFERIASRAVLGPVDRLCVSIGDVSSATSRMCARNGGTSPSSGRYGLYRRRTARRRSRRYSAFQHRLQIARRAADDLQHLAVAVCWCSDSAKIVGALAQLLEQPGVLDGYHGLFREVLDQRDLFIVEWRNGLVIDDRVIVPTNFVLHQHRYEEHRCDSPIWRREIVRRDPDMLLRRCIGMCTMHDLAFQAIARPL